MKLPFRFHRGEFNGFFLFNLVTFMNYTVQYIFDEIVYWCNAQFKISSEVDSENELPMRDSDIIGICKIAGVFPSYMAGGAWFGMVFLTESQIVNGVNRSERGLYVGATDQFKYVRTQNDDYPDDISTEASPAQRATLIPTGRTILGYVRADQQLYDESGNVIWANVLPAPPTDVAYDPFYGEDFLTMSNDANVVSAIPIALTKTVFELMQKIRYNGPSIKSFLDITSSLLGDYIYDISITYTNNYFLVSYHLDDTVLMESRLAHLSMWQYVIKTKFKLFELSQII